MTTLTIESPELTVAFPVTLIQKIQANKFSNERLTEVIVQLVDLYMNERGVSDGYFDQTWPDPVEFTKELISKHRKIFEELARR